MSTWLKEILYGYLFALPKSSLLSPACCIFFVTLMMHKGLWSVVGSDHQINVGVSGHSA